MKGQEVALCVVPSPANKEFQVWHKLKAILSPSLPISSIVHTDGFSYPNVHQYDLV